MDIKVLGTGCPKCKRLEALVREAIEQTGVAGNVSHVTDMSDIMAYDILSTPGLVIDGEVVSSGRLPRREEIAIWLKAAAG